MNTPEQLKHDEERTTFLSLIGLGVASILCFVAGFLLVESTLARTSLIVLGSASALFTTGMLIASRKEIASTFRRMRQGPAERRNDKKTNDQKSNNLK